MKKCTIGLILASGLLAGCETAFNHTQLSTDNVVSGARGMAQVSTCVERGYIPQDVGMRYGYAVTQYLSAVVYDKGLYEQSYHSSVATISSMSDSEIKTGCASMLPALPELTANVQRQTSDAIGWKAAGMQTMANQTAAAATSIGDNARQMGESSMANLPTTAPTNQVQFSPDSPFRTPVNTERQDQERNHYLINTPEGMARCDTYPSGYVYCY